MDLAPPGGAKIKFDTDDQKIGTKIREFDPQNLTPGYPSAYISLGRGPMRAVWRELEETGQQE